jgi:hypothetical protein
MASLYSLDKLSFLAKFLPRLERLAMDNYYSLFFLCTEDEEKKVYNIDTWYSMQQYPAALLMQAE